MGIKSQDAANGRTEQALSRGHLGRGEFVLFHLDFFQGKKVSGAWDEAPLNSEYLLAIKKLNKILQKRLVYLH